MFLPVRITRPVKSIGSPLLAPFSDVLISGMRFVRQGLARTGLVEDTDTAATEQIALESQVAILEHRLQRLSAQNEELRGMRAGGLHGMLLPADVVAMDSQSNRCSVTIDAGHRAGISTGMAIVAGTSSLADDTDVAQWLARSMLVGMVAGNVGSYTSRVVALSDPSMTGIKASIDRVEDGRYVRVAEVLLDGTGGRYMRAEMVDRSHDIRPGDLVICLDERFDVGMPLPIGTVIDTEQNRRNAALQNVMVQLLINPKDLSTVYAIDRRTSQEP